MEIGRVISRRYLLQRLIKRGQFCTVYQGVDQALQRTVAVKAVPAAYIPAYSAAVKMTSAFSHPNIVGLYDLVPEPETLYLVQEYVEGSDFTALLQTQLTPYEVADIGQQICLALLYAGSPSRKVSHGDLTPTGVMRDINGLIRVNNFALPSDLHHFQIWSTVGSEGASLSDPDLPWGQWSEGRQADDTRATALLLYQLLAGRPPGTTTVEPPPDGVLRFQRNMPRELCETIARAVARQHPQHIKTVEELYNELKTLTETLEPAVPVPVTAATAPHHEEVVHGRPQVVPIQQFSPSGTGRPELPLRQESPLRPAHDTENPGLNLSAYGGEQKLVLPAPEIAPPTVADVSLPPAAVRQMVYPQPQVEERRRTPFLLILLICLLVFALFFAVGYFAGLWIVPPHP